jgi:NitT/TauT family transport system ATP-binding protein
VTASIELLGLSKEYVDRAAGVVVPVLDDFSLRIEPGEFVSILGPSGCGKTTVLRIIAGLLAPSAGRVLIDGEPVLGPGGDRGMVFQDYALFPWRTVRGNIEFGLKLRGVPRRERAQVSDRLIQLTGLVQFAEQHPHQLSGGMQQRVGLARALANAPGVLLLDEPLAALDALTRLTMQEEVARICHESGPTVVLITHSVEEAVLFGDRVVVLSPRPARVNAELEIDLPHPRRWDAVRSSAVFEQQSAAALKAVLPSIASASAHST